MPTFVTLATAYTLSQFYRSFLAVVAGDVARDLGLDASDLGSLSAIWFASFALASLPVGYGLDGFGPRRTLCATMLAAVAGAVVFALAPSFAWALAGMALIGIGSSPVLMAAMYVFARDYAEARFAILSATMISVGSIGNLAGTSPLAWAAERFGWRASMLVIAGLTALAVAALWFVLEDRPRTATNGPSGEPKSGLADLLRVRAIWLMLPLVSISYAVVIATRSLWIAPFLRTVHGADASAIGRAGFAMALAMSLGSLAYGPVDRLLGTKRTVILGTIVTSASFIALGYLGPGDAGLVTVLLPVIGLSGMTYAILMSHGRGFMAPDVVGRGVTFLNIGFVGGAGILQWVSGRFVQSALDSGLPPGILYGRLFLVFGTLLLCALAIYVAAPSARRAAGSTPRPSRSKRARAGRRRTPRP